MTVDLEHFQPSFGTAVHLNVRCLVGLHGSVQDDDLDEAFSAVLEDAGDELDLLHYALGADEADRVQFLVGSQSLKPNASQVTLITLYESDESQPSHLVKQAFVHPNGEVIGLVALAARPDWFVSVYSTYSADRPELRTGARVWRLPPATLADGLSASPPNTVSVGLNDAVSEPANSSSSALEYVTTLPLDRYCGIRNFSKRTASKLVQPIILIFGNSADRPELRTGARVWRLPPATLADGLSASPPNTVSVGLNDAVSEPANSSSSALEYVTTLPLDRYCGIRK
ncbi:hypothetical protein P879_10504 [Paragonimus westermani]|uniref:Uncharacterized protein n=1 Tax=Paragonimus westermani TaxID=34504 RepID=A0A8T0DCK9_9TREM|nr:hypothetical protein P879_10504 [Paragonimus westermani]